MTVLEIQKTLIRLGDPIRVGILQNFFKTGPGEYGEGDVFLGITVPVLRQLAKQLLALSLSELEQLLRVKEHESRLLALLILNYQYPKADAIGKRAIYKFYLAHTQYVNNWDLVDVTCREIIGAELFNQDRAVLYKLAKSKSLWERRMAIVTTYYFLQRGQPEDTLALAEVLINDQHDLIHKAVGWMLREMGKLCDERLLMDFLDQHAMLMPRTMLRYAIERLPEVKRQHYLKLKN